MGVKIITTVWEPATAVQPAAPYDLTTLANAKDELKLATTDTKNDAWLSRAITQSSAAINRFCNHVFAVEGITDLLYLQQDPYPWQVPGGIGPLQLSRWPVVGVTTLPTSADTESGNVLPFASTAGVSVGAPVSGPHVWSDTSAAAVGPDSVTLSNPIARPVRAGTPITFGLAVWQALSARWNEHLVLGRDYTLDAENGQLVRRDIFTGIAIRWEAVPVTVSYSAGWATVPPDVEDATLRLVTMRWFSRGINPALRERDTQGLGHEVYWIGGPPKTGTLPDEVTGLVDRYRVPMAL